MFKKWEYIASFMDKPVNTVKGKMHAKAINELDEVINA